MATIDIILPTYNRSTLLHQTLESVKNQTFSDWRCWIAEDGETQETLEAIRQFLEDDRFRYLPGKHSGTPATPRNRAILQGDALYIAFLDDDDLWLPEKLEYQFEFMKQHPNCVLLGSNAFRWSGTGEWNRSLPLYFPETIQGQLHYKALVQNNSIINASAVICRSVLSESGLLNESRELRAFEDYDLWLRIGVLGEIWIMSEPLVVYRDTPASSIRSKTDIHHLYQIMANVFESALNGVGGVPSPFSCAENRHYASACRRQRDFYLAGAKPLSLWKQLKSLMYQ